MTAVREENGSLPASSLERLSSPDAAHGVSSPVLMARDDLLTALELQTSRFNIVLENIPQLDSGAVLFQR
jgi:hypothetical protein